MCITSSSLYWFRSCNCRVKFNTVGSKAAQTEHIGTQTRWLQNPSVRVWDNGRSKRKTCTSTTCEPTKHTSNNRYKRNQTACNCRLLTLKITKHKHHDKDPIPIWITTNSYTALLYSFQCIVGCNATWVNIHGWNNIHNYTTYCLVWNKHIHNALLDIGNGTQRQEVG